MKPKTVRQALNLALLACALVAGAIISLAQEAGGDLGGGAGIFRPKNPETSSKRRTRPSGAHSRPNNRPTNRPAADVSGEVEDFVDEGNEARDTKKFAVAEKAYKAALRLNAREWRAAYGLGNIYTDQHRWEEAELAYKQSVQSNASNADTYVALSYVLLQPRSGGSQAKRLADAEVAARRAIMLQSNNAVAYDRLGAALEARGLSAVETEQAYRKATELDPQFAVGYVHLARLVRRDPKRAQEAGPLYDKALTLAKDAPTLVLIGDALQSEQRFKDSEKPLKAALELDEKNPSALFLLGKMFVVLKEYRDAESYLQKAIEISPHSFEPYQVLGSAYLRDNRLENAEEVFLKASGIAPAPAKKQLAGSYGLSGVGDAYASGGRRTDAIRAYQAALRLDPQNADLQKKITDLSARPN
jgi:tetratricopeptide (TPR) repeat protein